MEIYKDVVDKNKELLYSEIMSINFEGIDSVPNSNRTKNPALKNQTSRAFPNTIVGNQFLDQNEDSIEKDEYDEDETYVVWVEDDYGRRSIKGEDGKRHTRSRSNELKLASKQHDFEMKKLPKMWEIEKRIKKRPYHDAILKLRELDSTEGPMMKLRLLEYVNQMLKDNIGEFWDGVPVDKDSLTITSDTKIPIYIYIVLKSKLANLPAQIRFIQEFTTKFVHENNLGSNLALYESAMMLVADDNSDNIFDLKEQDRAVQRATFFNQSFAASVFMDDVDPFVEFDPLDTTIN